jgi:hypothetical protein
MQWPKTHTGMMGDGIGKSWEKKDRRSDLGEGTRRHPRERARRRARGQGRPGGRNPHRHVCHTSNCASRKGSGRPKTRGMPTPHTTAPRRSRHRLQEVHARQGEELYRTRSGPDQDWPLALSVYLKRIRKRETDHCWLCDGVGPESTQDVTGTCVDELPQPQVVAARAEAWEGKNPGSVWRLLADPRWEKRFVRFLELSGVGRTLADGTDEESAYAARMDTWIAWETEDVVEVERSTPRGDG